MSGAELAKFPLLAQLAETKREAVADELEPAEFAAGIRESAPRRRAPVDPVRASD